LAICSTTKTQTLAEGATALEPAAKVKVGSQIFWHSHKRETWILLLQTKFLLEVCTSLGSMTTVKLSDANGIFGGSALILGQSQMSTLSFGPTCK